MFLARSLLFLCGVAFCTNHHHDFGFLFYDDTETLGEWPGFEIYKEGEPSVPVDYHCQLNDHGISMSNGGMKRGRRELEGEQLDMPAASMDVPEPLFNVDDFWVDSPVQSRSYDEALLFSKPEPSVPLAFICGLPVNLVVDTCGCLWFKPQAPITGLSLTPTIFNGEVFYALSERTLQVDIPFGDNPEEKRPYVQGLLLKAVLSAYFRTFDHNAAYPYDLPFEYDLINAMIIVGHVRHNWEYSVDDSTKPLPRIFLTPSSSQKQTVDPKIVVKIFEAFFGDSYTRGAKFKLHLVHDFVMFRLMAKYGQVVFTGDTTPAPYPGLPAYMDSNDVNLSAVWQFYVHFVMNKRFFNPKHVLMFAGKTEYSLWQTHIAMVRALLLNGFGFPDYHADALQHKSSFGGCVNDALRLVDFMEKAIQREGVIERKDLILLLPGGDNSDARDLMSTLQPAKSPDARFLPELVLVKLISTFVRYISVFYNRTLQLVNETDPSDITRFESVRLGRLGRLVRKAVPDFLGTVVNLAEDAQICKSYTDVLSAAIKYLDGENIITCSNITAYQEFMAVRAKFLHLVGEPDFLKALKISIDRVEAKRLLRRQQRKVRFNIVPAADPLASSDGSDSPDGTSASVTTSNRPKH